VEKIGIERTWQEVARADVIVHLRVAQPSGPATAAAQAAGDEGRAALAADLDADIAARLPQGKPILRVWNKIDLAGVAPQASDDEVWLSARTGEGVGLLRAALLRLAGWQGGGEGVFIARARHLEALRAAEAHLAAAHDHALRRADALDLFAEELRLAQERLSAITGEFGADDLLGVIFSRFCIGK
jgi:tRNA modification GTPase